MVATMIACSNGDRDPASTGTGDGEASGGQSIGLDESAGSTSTSSGSSTSSSETTTSAVETDGVETDGVETDGAGECDYAPPDGAIDFRTTECAPATAGVSARLSCAIALAARSPVFDPPPDPSGFGPFATQGVVHIAFDPGSPAYGGANALRFDEAVGHASTFVDFPSNVRLEIDAGVALVYADPSVEGTLFEWDDVQNVSITRGNPCHGNGRFVVDLESFIDGLTDHARFLVLRDVDGFLLEHVHTVSAFSPDVGGAGGGNGSGAPVVRFFPSAEGRPPRHGLYRHHSNQGSGPGWGPNQIASLADTSIEDIWTEGGTTVRFETSNGSIGSHRVTVDHIFGRNGNAVVAFTPHDASSSDIHVTDVNGISMAVGVVASGTGPAAGAGVFTNTTVAGGCVVAGDAAQDSDGTAMQSAAAVQLRIAKGADVSVSDVARSGDFASTHPGGVTDAECDARSAAAGFADWTVDLP